MPGKTVAAGYGAKHKRLRKRWAPKVRAGKVCCWRCGKLIAPGAKWDLGHDDDDRSLPAKPEHVGCNRATLPRMLAKARGEDRFGGLPDPDPGNTVDRWSRHWYGGFNPRCRDCRSRGAACDDARQGATP